MNKIKAFYQSGKNRISKSLSAPRLSSKERIHFAKRLSYLVSGGIPIVESLIILKKQNHSKAKILFYETLIADVSNGQYLSTSLRKFKNIFNDFAVNIIRVGEESGILNQNLNYLGKYCMIRHQYNFCIDVLPILRLLLYVLLLIVSGNHRNI